VDTFFAVGSPLGVFLALRNVRIGIGKGKDYWEDENIIEEMPSCRQMFNIFHPYDPVAYRVEPLVCKEYLDKRAVIIPYHRGGKRLHVGYQEFVEGVASRSQVVVDQMSVAKVKSSEESEEIERSYGSLMLERLTGSQDGRVDHVLQNKTFEHQYISAVGAHT
nr:phospholipase SGR2 [Tanacetum cinerariifolium]